MKLFGNSILITGGGSGIGLGLAEAFKAAGNDVLVAGRSRDKLADAARRGLRTLTVDMTDASSIRELADRARREMPNLDGVVHAAGIMVNEKVTSGDTSEVAEQTVATNLLGPIRLTNALLPHLLARPSAFVMTVTSGLAFVPLAMTPTYCATKAAIHSYTQSLRYQLRETGVEVIELVPPYVRTALMGERQAGDANAMPLENFVTEVMTLLRERPGADEILVERVRPQRTAGFEPEAYAKMFNGQNERLMAARRAEWDAL